MALIFIVWYPAPTDKATGVRHVAAILLGVDVVLGPLLTAIVYKADRRQFCRDLSIIVIAQLAALCYGMYAIAIGRPVWLVFNADRFDLTQALDIDERFLRDARPEFVRTSWLGPKWVASRNPTDPEKRNQLVLESAGGGSDLPQRVDLFAPVAEEASQVRARARPLSDLKNYNVPARVGEVLREWPQADAWLPLMAKAQPMVVLIDSKTALPVALVDLRPWD